MHPSHSRTQVRVMQKTYDQLEYLAEDNFKNRTANILLKRIIAGDFNHLRKPEVEAKIPIFVDKQLTSEAFEVARQLGYTRLGDFIDKIFEAELMDADDIFHTSEEEDTFL